MNTSADLFSSLVPLIILFTVLYLLFFKRTNKEYKSLPTLDEYLTSYPNCKTSNGIQCIKCNSKSIKNWGVSSKNDLRRFHICNHCNTKLYKS